MWEKEHKEKDQTVEQQEKGYMVNNTKRSKKSDVDRAMQNPDAYLSFVRTKGYGMDKEKHIQKRV